MMQDGSEAKTMEDKWVREWEGGWGGGRAESGKEGWKVLDEPYLPDASLG